MEVCLDLMDEESKRCDERGEEDCLDKYTRLCLEGSIMPNLLFMA